MIIHNISGFGGPALTIPKVFRPIRKTVLEPPWNDFKLNGSFVSDVIINILGFIPFGFLMAVCWLKSGIAVKVVYPIAGFTGLGLGLSIELIQVYIPARYSQLLDVICNTAGAIIGIICARSFHNYESQEKAPSCNSYPSNICGTIP